MTVLTTREKIILETCLCKFCQAEHSLQAKLSYETGEGLSFIFDQIRVRDGRGTCIEPLQEILSVDLGTIEHGARLTYKSLGLEQGLLVPQLREKIVFELQELHRPCQDTLVLKYLASRVLERFVGVDFVTEDSYLKTDDFTVIEAILNRYRIKKNESTFKGYLGGKPDCPLLCFYENTSSPALALEFDAKHLFLNEQSLYPEDISPFSFECTIFGSLELNEEGLPKVSNIQRIMLFAEISFCNK